MFKRLLFQCGGLRVSVAGNTALTTEATAVVGAAAVLPLVDRWWPLAMCMLVAWPALLEAGLAGWLCAECWFAVLAAAMACVTAPCTTVAT
jgi:hypothetical protein